VKGLLETARSGPRVFRYLYEPGRELPELFGHPLPRLPRGDEVAPGRRRIFVDLAPQAGLLVRQYLQAVHPVLTGEARDYPASAATALREMVARAVEQALRQDRRAGLVDLFFISLAKVLGEAVGAFFGAGGRKPYHKYLLHPYLSSLLREAEAEARRRVGEDGVPRGGII